MYELNAANYLKDQRRPSSRLATVMFCGTPCTRLYACLSIFLFLRSILNHLFSYSSSFSIIIIQLTSYSRISSEQPNYHPSSPQRSHTLSLIPSHTSRTKLGNAAVKTTFSSATSSSVQYTQSSSSSTQSTQSTGSSTQSTQSTGSSVQSGSSVRFNTESTNTSTGRGTIAVQYNNNQPGKRMNTPSWILQGYPISTVIAKTRWKETLKTIV